MLIAIHHRKEWEMRENGRGEREMKNEGREELQSAIISGLFVLIFLSF